VNTVAQLEQEWPLLAQRALAGALPRWRAAQAPLRPFGTASELLRFLHAHPPRRTDAPLLALLLLARTDRLAGRFVLQAILPALRAQAERIRRRGARREEVWELLFFYAWEAICAYPVERRPARVAANLVLQVLHDTTRELRRAHDEGRGVRASDRLDRLGGEHEPDPPARYRTPELPLRQAVEAGAIAAADAELILATRVDGARLQTLAATNGCGYGRLLKRRQRAETALRGWLSPPTAVRKPGSADLIPDASRFSPRARATRHHPLQAGEPPGPMPAA
jgi:hypothetical protein